MSAYDTWFFVHEYMQFICNVVQLIQRGRFLWLYRHHSVFA